MKKIRSLEEAIEYALEQNVLIAGIAMNVGQYLDNVFENIKRILSLFKSYKVLVFENDSTDNTLSILKDWSRNDKNVSILSQTNIKGTIEGRTHMISYCRNMILNSIDMHSAYNSIDYIIFIDMDDVLSHNFKVENILTSFQYDDWAGMGACHSQGYYDVWALRDKKINFSCWDKITHLTQVGKTYDEAVEECVYKFRYKFNDNDEPYEVDSCFGGLMIYKTDKIKNCWYSGDYICNIKLEGKGNCIFGDCEHANFNKQIREKNNGRIFINPAMKIM